MAAISIAKGVGFIPPNYPILGPFLVRLLSLQFELRPEQLKELNEIREQEHKIRRTEAFDALDTGSMRAEFSVRYGLSAEEIEDAEELISNAPFPCRLHHRVFFVIAEVDYS